MMSYWLDKLLGDNDDWNNLSKSAPLVIFFVIWLFSAIAKARAGKKGGEKELSEGQEEQKPSFDDLAEKIRERYSAAKEQANRGVQQGENASSQPPARTPQSKPPPPRRPEPIPAKKPVAPPMYSQEGPTLKVEPDLHKVDAITPENAKVSSEVEIHQQHSYLAELAEQYATQDGFRKAILNYEILGPPLALREKLGPHWVL
jgi:hypothetical protein